MDNYICSKKQVIQTLADSEIEQTFPEQVS